MTDEHPVQQCDDTEPHHDHVQAFYRQDGPGTFTRDDYRYCPGVADPRIRELEEMLTAATDTAVQRGKRIDKVRAALDKVHYGMYAEHLVIEDVREALDGG